MNRIGEGRLRFDRRNMKVMKGSSFDGINMINKILVWNGVSGSGAFLP
jgi:hypothetical protein